MDVVKIFISIVFFFLIMLEQNWMTVEVVLIIFIITHSSTFCIVNEQLFDNGDLLPQFPSSEENSRDDRVALRKKPIFRTVTVDI